MLLSRYQVIARMVHPRWMRMAIAGRKTCEVTQTRMSKRIRRGIRKTHLFMHVTMHGRGTVPDLIAELLPGKPLGPYSVDMVDTLMADSVRLDFRTGMSREEMLEFIRATPRGEVYIYRYANARVCTELRWVDSIYNNNAGFLEDWNRTKGCTRFCFRDEAPVLYPEPQPPHGWERVDPGDELLAEDSPRLCQLKRIDSKKRKPVAASLPPFKIPRKQPVVVVIED